MDHRQLFFESRWLQIHHVRDIFLHNPEENDRRNVMSAQERDVEQPLAGSKRKFDGVDEEKKNDDAEYCSPCTDKESTTKASSRRHNAISWDDYFMSVAFLSSMRSKDPSTQVGACIVNPNKRIVGIGYNGFPRGCSDDELPWAREGESELDTKYPVSITALQFRVSSSVSVSMADNVATTVRLPCGSERYSKQKQR